MDRARYESIPLATPRPAGELPSSMDLTRWLPVPGDQGQQASCVAWATAYAMKTYQEERERSWGVEAPEHIFSPAYVYNQILQRGQNCSSGVEIPQAFEVLRSGAAPLSVFPYNPTRCDGRPDARIFHIATEFAIVEVRRVNVQDAAELKTQLRDGIPVVLALVVDQSFIAHRGTQALTGPVGKIKGAHAVLLVGYDDTKNAFRIMNSWGTAWGDGGFAWIGYERLMRSAREGYVTLDKRSGPVELAAELAEAVSLSSHTMAVDTSSPCTIKLIERGPGRYWEFEIDKMLVGSPEKVGANYQVLFSSVSGKAVFASREGKNIPEVSVLIQGQANADAIVQKALALQAMCPNPSR